MAQTLHDLPDKKYNFPPKEYVLKKKDDQRNNPAAGKTMLTRRNFLTGAGATLSTVLLHGRKATGQQDEPEQLASQKASEVLNQLNAGVPFDKLAREYSIARSAADGGYVGEVNLSALQPEIQAALRGLVPGEVSGIIDTLSGYMIVKLVPVGAAVEMGQMAYETKLADAAQKNVRNVTEVDGYSVVMDFFNRDPKPPNWSQNLQAICQSHRRALAQASRVTQARLNGLKAQTPNPSNATAMMNAYEARAQFEAYNGPMTNSIQNFLAEYQIAASSGAGKAQHKLEEKLGIACMFQADTENSAKTANIESSVFPIRPEAKLKLAAGEDTAVKHFLNYLGEEPADLGVKWLLNIACMKLGKYPQAVPAQHVIPPDAFKSDEEIGRFINVAPSLGLDIVDISGGLIVDDFDNDGFLDIVTSSFNPCTPMRYFHNNGDGTFSDRTVESGLANQLGGLNLIQADYNNDGWMDILVLRGAWQPAMRKSLLRNNGNGTFTDVTQDCGLAVPATSTQTAAWADFDNDGYLDLFVGNETSPCQLFQNRGGARFVDVGAPAGVAHSRGTKGVAAGDYDNDGYPDFYVSNMEGENYLYHNNGDGTFTDMAKELHVELPVVSFPVWFFDYNNDGWLDIFVNSDYHSVSEFAKSYLRLPLAAEGAKLYRNTGKGTFQDVSKEARVDRSFMTMGCNFGDFDNDGFLDCYLGTGGPSYGALVPNVLLKNNNGEYFADVTTSSGTGSLEKGHGVAFADINNDGTEEILIRLGGATPADHAAMMIFRPPKNENNWITIHLVGVKTNRAAIGARIKVTVEAADHNTRSIHRVVGSGGSFGASPLRQHIGLGRAKRIEAVEIWWPTSKTRQTFRDVPMNQFIEIKEFAKNFAVQPRRSFPLSGRRE